MTALMVVLTAAYFVLGVIALGTTIPFEVVLWGGLILIFGWWAHDTVRERRVEA